VVEQRFCKTFFSEIQKALILLGNLAQLLSLLVIYAFQQRHWKTLRCTIEETVEGFVEGFFNQNTHGLFFIFATAQRFALFFGPRSVVCPVRIHHQHSEQLT